MNRHSDAVVLLHGFLGSSSDWSDVVDRLGAGLSFITPDLPGHGNTRLPAPEPTMRMVVEWLHGVVQSAGSDRVVLVGYSMGGRIAMHYALAHP
ncbi:MAG TPA: alpha/beta fold hydrolase, partial [Rhodothermales bacterium]